MEERRIGKVTHFFARIGVAVFALTDPLKVGDTIRIRGRSTDLTQCVESMQIEHKEVQEAKPGDEVAVKVTGRVREDDAVYKVIP
ncbi:MAG: translation elongation factor-like protein [Candidatus Acetothermia bacterium]|jgi:putative protease|nr:translation elongation factor-like protein [Candidatus Acetothermia bacterium]